MVHSTVGIGLGEVTKMQTIFLVSTCLVLDVEAMLPGTSAPQSLKQVLGLKNIEEHQNTNVVLLDHTSSEISILQQADPTIQILWCFIDYIV